MSFVSVRATSTYFVNFGLSGGRSTLTRWLHSSAPLSTRGLITVTPFSLLAGSRRTVTEKLQAYSVC